MKKILLGAVITLTLFFVSKAAFADIYCTDYIVQVISGGDNIYVGSGTTTGDHAFFKSKTVCANYWCSMSLFSDSGALNLAMMSINESLVLGKSVTMHWPKLSACTPLTYAQETPDLVILNLQ